MNLENSRVVCTHVLRGVRRDYETVQLGLPSLVFLSSVASFPQAAFRRPPTCYFENPSLKLPMSHPYCVLHGCTQSPGTQQLCLPQAFLSPSKEQAGRAPGRLQG